MLRLCSFDVRGPRSGLRPEHPARTSHVTGAAGLVLLCVVVVGAGCSCGDSHTPDAGITFDAMAPMDGGTRDGGPEFIPSVCGDGMLGPMEGCDDGNTADGDGCNAMCRREAFCGDGDMGMGEVCDDGNNRSGDGCRSDCQSDESCGNSITDIAAGELCDDGNTDDGDGCSGDCTIVESCGDSTIDTMNGETCDDGNTLAFDGCGPDCRDEISLVIDNLALGMEMDGCDFSGDGRPDNNFASALGPLRDILPMNIAESVTILLHMLGLDDATGADDPSFTVGWLAGEPAMAPGEYLADSGAIDPVTGLPYATFASMLMRNRLSGGPEDIEIPIFILPLEIRQARIFGNTRATGGFWTNIDDGLICGAVPMGAFALFPLPPGIPVIGDAMPCDGSAAPPTIADILVGGLPLFGLMGTQPDVDLDLDGLEVFTVTRRGPAGCQPVITGCIDGDGTRVDGRGCAMDARFEDGFSIGLPFTAVEAMIVGTTGGMMPPGP